jgi:hypothetical protein
MITVLLNLMEAVGSNDRHGGSVLEAVAPVLLQACAGLPGKATLKTFKRRPAGQTG